MEERDFGAEELKNGEKVAEEKTKYVVEELGDNPEFTSTTTTSLDDSGVPISERTVTQYLAGCGHWVAKPDDLSGKCTVCGKHLCKDCASTICSNCKTQPLCPTCSRLWRPAQELATERGQVLKVAEEVLCPRCYRLLLTGRIFRSIFGGIHRFLSREISDGK